jgi:hypothetical protein
MITHYVFFEAGTELFGFHDIRPLSVLLEVLAHSPHIYRGKSKVDYHKIKIWRQEQSEHARRSKYIQW